VAQGNNGHIGANFEVAASDCLARRYSGRYDNYFGSADALNIVHDIEGAAVTHPVEGGIGEADAKDAYESTLALRGFRGRGLGSFFYLFCLFRDGFWGSFCCISQNGSPSLAGLSVQSAEFASS
jgi:hypothetical protein